MPLLAVITTIQSPTHAVSELVARLVRAGQLVIVIGDKKGPASYELAGTEFFSLQRQLDSRFDLARALPVGHYARKNVGYLEAMALGASSIYETDDDNAPLGNWAERREKVEVREVIQSGWVNVYRCFKNERIWPRGYPLDALRESFESVPVLRNARQNVIAPIQQGLANGSPDVDAIWRLVLDQAFNFDDRPSVLLPAGSWCPFNSQSTWWWPAAYPLMYLPSYCSFRMTDIWRSFIAQRCLWELDCGVVFHASEVFQKRNEHDLMRDFAEEIDGYLRNKGLVETLSSLSLRSGDCHQSANLRHCYETLVVKGFVPEKELQLVDAWLNDIQVIQNQFAG